jgi:succinoglycan biosynthesis transport protein ExoP
MAFYLKVLWKRKFLIAMTTIVTLAVAVAGIAQMETVYTAQTMLRVIPFGIEKPDYGTYVYFDQLSNTFITILESSAVRDAAKLRLNMDHLPEWQVDNVPNTELLQISVTDQDPELAQTVANTLAEVLIEQVQSQYLAGVDSIEATLGARIDALDTEIADLVQQQTTLENQTPRDSVKIAAITSAIAARQDTRSGLLGSYSQALVAQAAQANTISIISPAKVPDRPSGLNRSLILAVAAAVGIAGGIVLAFIMQNLLPQICTPGQLERIAGFPIVGDLPPISRNLRPDFFAHKSEGAEVLRRLRAKLLQTDQENALKTLLVTSPDSNRTGAIVAANFAISLTYVYPHVLIIDANIRQPFLAGLWNLASDCGLSHVLNDGAALDDAIQCGPRPNLDVMVAGAPDPTAVDWIASRHFTTMLHDLQARYDMIVLHGAPLVAYADSIVLSKQASDILLVVRKNSAEKQVKLAGQELAPVASKVLGIVIT